MLLNKGRCSDRSVTYSPYPGNEAFEAAAAEGNRGLEGWPLGPVGWPLYMTGEGPATPAVLQGALEYNTQSRHRVSHLTSTNLEFI